MDAAQLALAENRLNFHHINQILRFQNISPEWKPNS